MCAFAVSHLHSERIFYWRWRRSLLILKKKKWLPFFFFFFTNILIRPHICGKGNVCFIKSPPPSPLSASFGRDDSWQAPLIFSLTAHTVTKASVVHRKWALISIFRMTSHAQCISSRHRLCHVVPGGELLISLHYHYRSTSRIGGQGEIKISHHLTLSLYIEKNPSSKTWKRPSQDLTFSSSACVSSSLLRSHLRIIVSQQKM